MLTLGDVEGAWTSSEGVEWIPRCEECDKPLVGRTVAREGKECTCCEGCERRVTGRVDAACVSTAGACDGGSTAAVTIGLCDDEARVRAVLLLVVLGGTACGGIWWVDSGWGGEMPS